MTIEHVIVLAFENRSFDHMLGCMQSFDSKIDGIPVAGAARTNEFGGEQYPQAPGAARIVQKDPMHEHPHVVRQLAADAGGKPNGGFVRDYAESYPSLGRADRGEVMKFHALDSLSALHALAREFTVCDRWFSSVPGPTWTNRLFAMSGTSLGRVNMPEGVMNLNVHWYNQPTVFDRLNERSKSWKVYFSDAPLSLLLVHQWEPPNSIRHRPMMEFYKDVAGAAKDFPAFAWIEPAYLQPGANDCHPPHDVFESQVLLANVYNAIRANEDLWNSSLFVVLFDEHGGFYDHVAPPNAVPPDHHQEEYTFDMLGVRVPAILVSPWMGRRVISEQFDHTSLLRYLTDKWGLGALGERTAQAKSFEPFFLPERRTDTPRSIPKPQALAGPHPVPVETLTAHQNGVLALSHALESMTDEDPSVIAARSRQVLSGPQSQIDAAVDRVTAFLAQQSSKALPK